MTNYWIPIINWSGREEGAQVHVRADLWGGYDSGTLSNSSECHGVTGTILHQDCQVVTEPNVIVQEH